MSFVAYRPITAAADLPGIGMKHETAILDFKTVVTPSETLELAKDVAAFANQLGGTILVGAKEGNDGLLERWVPLDPTRASDVQTAYERASMDMLSPRPRVVAMRIPIAGGECVAVNVEPHLDGVVAARADASRVHVWLYPIRIGKETRYLTPEEVASMTPQTRKAIVMLSRIAAGDRLSRVWETLLNGQRVHEANWTFVRVDFTENVLVLAAQDGSSRSLPLDMVRSVYRDEHGWQVVVESFR